MTKIKKIPLTKAKTQLRYGGVALTRKEKAMMLKINELVDVVNELTKKED